MGRPYKPGLDRTQFDVGYSRKPDSLRIRQKFGLEGLAVLYEVLTWINEGKGCYAEASDLETAAFEFATTRLFDVSKIDWVKEVFSFMLDIGFFDRAAFEKDRVLTSQGIVSRWWRAKRDPDSYPLPESVLAYIPDKEAPESQEPAENETYSNQQQPDNNPQQSYKNCNNSSKTAITATKKRKVLKQTNKQASAEISAAETESNPDPGTGRPPAPAEEVVRCAKGVTEWCRTREEVKRLIFFRGISADLVDAAAACVVNGWITIAGIRNMGRKARDETELFVSSKCRRGKQHGWETVRDCVALLFREHDMEPPTYSRHNPEPPCDNRRREPPPPEANDDVGYDAATRAGRAVMAVT